MQFACQDIFFVLCVTDPFGMFCFLKGTIHHKEALRQEEQWSKISVKIEDSLRRQEVTERVGWALGRGFHQIISLLFFSLLLAARVPPRFVPHAAGLLLVVTLIFPPYRRGD